MRISFIFSALFVPIILGLVTSPFKYYKPIDPCDSPIFSATITPLSYIAILGIFFAITAILGWVRARIAIVVIISIIIFLYTQKIDHEHTEKIAQNHILENNTNGAAHAGQVNDCF